MLFCGCIPESSLKSVWGGAYSFMAPTLHDWATELCKELQKYWWKIFVSVYSDCILSYLDYSWPAAASPGMRTGMCWVRAPGRTFTSSVSMLKQHWRVFTLFSFSCLCRAFTIMGTCGGRQMLPENHRRPLQVLPAACGQPCRMLRVSCRRENQRYAPKSCAALTSTVGNLNYSQRPVRNCAERKLYTHFSYRVSTDWLQGGDNFYLLYLNNLLLNLI